MELDNLKDLWRDLGQTEVHHNSDEQIILMLQKRSKSPIAKMKRNLRWELIAVVILYSLPIWHFFTVHQARYWELALFLLVIGIFFIFYYYHKNKLLGEMQCVTCEVRSNLEKQLITLEKYVRFYFISGTILTPVAFFVAAFIVWFKSPVTGVSKSLNSIQYTYIIGLGIIVTILSYLLNKWYVNKLYGQHIKKLKNLLHQMEEKETGL